MRQGRNQLTEHLDQLVHCSSDILYSHNKYHEADVNDIEGTDKLLGNRVTYIPLLECDVGRECLGRWRCIE